MKVIETGHVYDLKRLESKGYERLTFIKRSSGAIQYNDEHSGTNTQEVIRALIERTGYLHSVLPCDETADAIYYLRMALYCYEVRAYRRKQQKYNKHANLHESNEPNPHRDGYDDVPFSEFEIETLPVGKDGHIKF